MRKWVIAVQEEIVNYKENKILVEIFSSRKYKNISIRVNKGYVRISKPNYVSKKAAMNFFYENIDDILKTIERLKKVEAEERLEEGAIIFFRGEKKYLKIRHEEVDHVKLEIKESKVLFTVPSDISEKDLQGTFKVCYKKLLKKNTKRFLDTRLDFWADKIGVSYNRVSIKCQKTVWGSAVKARKNLNFNMKLAMLPDTVADYILVHELCHFIEANHSEKFWDLVEKHMPDYKEKIYYIKSNQKYFDIV